MTAANRKLSAAQTVLSIQDFKNLIQVSSVSELQKIPLEALPRVIPDEVLNSTTGLMRKTLENIIFELNMREVSERVELESKYSAEVSDALFYFSDYFGKENFTRLNKKLVELGLLYKTWKIDNDEQKRQDLLPKIKELNGLIDIIKRETKSVIKARVTLAQNIKNVGKDKAQFVAEIENLQYIIKRNEQKMSQYYHLRLLVIGADMRDLSSKIKDSSDLIAIVQDSISLNHAQLNQLTGKSLLPGFKKKVKGNKNFIDKLRQETNALLSQKKALEVPISETALIAWLDVVVDATLTDDKRQGSIALLGRVRMTLFHLLQQYCLQQEAAAMDVAQHPFSQTSPETVIKFLLQSEEFILQYFRNKRLETASWMGNLAESKVDMLGKIEKQLLKELKKNSKFHK